ncbi:MAG: TCP-1/cpn60 chaperonin family protein [Gloeobacterales cyanobacterium]
MSHVPSEERLRVVRTNIAAVQVIVETVSGTLGPKGLDVLLVDELGRIILTNDGIEILRQLDAQHPCARLVIQAIEAQETAVGDGTTTATVMAGALLESALLALQKGVPVNPILSGMSKAVSVAVHALEEMAQPVPFDSPLLLQTALIAARGDETLAQLVVEGVRTLGPEKLKDPEFRLSSVIAPRLGQASQLVAGTVLSKPALNPPLISWEKAGGVLVIADALEPESLDPQALGTESGFNQYLAAQNRFREALQNLSGRGIVVLLAEKSIDPAALDVLNQLGVLAFERVSRRDWQRICRFTGAAPITRRALASKNLPLGKAQARYSGEQARLLFTEGAGEPTVTLQVGAISNEVLAENVRVTTDSCGAVQAALRMGIVAGGGAAEVACRPAVQQLLEQTQTLERFGIQSVLEALSRPLEQMLSNAGYAPLEKSAQVLAQQRIEQNPHLGIDQETGNITDLWQLGIVDPTEVKTHALRVASEIAGRVLRIQTIVRKREESL